MIKGYVSSDEDDDDDYDFGYSEPLVREKKSPVLPEIQTQEGKAIIDTAISESSKIETFLKAVDQGDLDTLEEFVSKGVSVDCTDSQGWSPLLKACGMGHFEVVQFLLEHGANPNKHRELLTPLMTCCTQTLVEENLKLNCIRLLLENGAEVNAKDKFQTTALMYAARSGYKVIVTELLGVPGVEVNIQDREGWTALFHAVSQNHVDVVKKLKAAGSNLNLKDKFERTPLNLALDKNLMKVAKALGYVEEKIVSKQKKKKSKDVLLEDLPDSNGQGGFYRDARAILVAFNQKNFQKTTLPDLLNATEKDLYEIGVRLRPDRHKLLVKGIHRYHLCPWKSSSLHQIKPGSPFNVEDAVAIAGTVAKHLTIANASLRYLETRICSRQDKELVDLGVEKELVLCLIRTYDSAAKLQTLLSKLLNHIEQINLEIPPDYIYPPEKKLLWKGILRHFWLVFGVTTTGFLIFYSPVRCFRMLTTLVLQHISPRAGIHESRIDRMHYYSDEISNFLHPDFF